MLPVTRNSTGKLPPSQNRLDSSVTSSNSAVKAALKTVPDDKSEQQQRTPRIIQQQKRTIESKPGKKPTTNFP